MTGRDDIRHLAELLARAQSVLVITGAGVSADSGLPTYRGVGGLYEREATEDGIPIELALSGPMMAAQPELSWKYIAEIERACRGARPNRAHEAIAELERRIERCWLLTQNVDGLHRAAGSKNVVEIHGNVRRLKCTRCEHRDEVEDFSGLEIPPRCPSCGAIVRPDVILFGERLPANELARLREASVGGFDVVVSAGTSSAFPYIAAPVLEARAAGAVTVEINPGESEVSEVVHHRIRERAAPAFDALLEVL